MKKQCKVILQNNKYDCAFACLAMLFSYKDIEVPTSAFTENEIIGRDGVSLKDLKDICTKKQATLKIYRVEKEEFKKLRVNINKPYLVYWNNNHYVILEKIKKNKIVIIDPAVGRITISLQEFLVHYSGLMAGLEKRKSNKEIFELENQKDNRKMIKWLFPYKTTIIAVFLTSIVFQSVNLIFPLLTQILIDNGEVVKNIPGKILLIGTLIIGILYFVLHVTRVKLIAEIQCKLSNKMTSTFIEKLFKLPLNFFENNTIGDITSRVNNIGNIRDILSHIAVSVFLDVSVIIIYIFFMLQYSVILSLITFGVAILQVIILRIMIPKISEYTNKELVSQAKFQTMLHEILRSINYVKTSGNSQKIRQNMENEFQEQMISFKNRMGISAIMGGASSSINLILPLLSIAINLIFIDKVGLSTGRIVAFSTIALRFLTPVGSLISSYESIQVVDEMFKRMSNILEAREESDGENAIDMKKFEGNLELRDLSFSYGKNVVLQKFNLKICNGEKILIKGKSGEGKTTLFKIVSGLYDPSSGKRIICGKEYSCFTKESLRRRIGYIVQETGLFNGTIRENISFFQDMTDEEIIRASQIACIHEDICKLPMGYDTVLGDNGMTLSGGQKQRMAIARTLAANPDILLIDEGTSNLDMQTEKKVINNLMKLDKTIMFISHRHSHIEGVNKTYFLKDSHLILENVSE
jgi:ABC-type bacteriocin/lantibiotic exporter with double-glycine peptidase domain